MACTYNFSRYNWIGNISSLDEDLLFTIDYIEYNDIFGEDLISSNSIEIIATNNVLFKSVVFCYPIRITHEKIPTLLIAISFG